MKLRQTPEDFIVDEVPDFRPDPAGRFFVYQITKRSAATLEVLEVIRKALRLTHRDVSASGLKDKHAVATQLISVSRPLPADFSHPSFDWKFAGKSAGRLTADNVVQNRFAITARQLRAEDLAGLPGAIESVQKYGVPNYYDSQRFGGGGPDAMPGRELVRGNFEEALRMYIAVPRRKQSMRDKRVRRLAAEHWGDWKRLLEKLPRCREMAAVAHLVKVEGDWIGALERCDPKVMQLYVAAFQSHLFNQLLRRAVARHVPEGLLVDLSSKAGALPFWRELPAAAEEALAGLELPLPARDSVLDDLPVEVREDLAAVLSEEGLELEQLAVKGLRNVRLRGAMRMARVVPEGLEVEGPAVDELNQGYLKVTARFVLPRGSFATIVMKRLGMRG